MPESRHGARASAFSASARSGSRAPPFPQPCAEALRAPFPLPSRARHPRFRAARRAPGRCGRFPGGFAPPDGAARSRNAFRRWSPSGYAAHRPRTPSCPNGADRVPRAYVPPYRRRASRCTLSKARPPSRSAARCTRGRDRTDEPAAFPPSPWRRAARPRADPARPPSPNGYRRMRESAPRPRQDAAPL